MDAVVLVGGEGTRLRPLTYDTPKQLLPIVDRPGIVHVARWLAAHGVERVVLSLGYRPLAFVEAFPDGRIEGMELVYAIEPEPLDTAGAIRFAAAEAGVTERFLVLNGDVLTDFDVTELVLLHERTGAEASIHLAPVPDPSAFGVVDLGPEGLVRAFVEKPPSGTAPTNLINAGTYVLEPSVLSLIPAGRPVSVERETFPALASKGTLRALASRAYWIDTGTPAKFIEAALDILASRRQDRGVYPCVPEVAPGVFRDPRSVVSPASPTSSGAGPIRGVAFLGADCRVDATGGTEVRESVLSAACEVCEGASVVGSVILEGAVVEQKAQVTDSIIGPGAVIGAGARVAGGSVVRGGSRLEAGAALDAARFPVA